MSALWSSAEAAAATKGQTKTEWNAAGVSIDSRTVIAGDLFVAIAGPRVDGHDFVAAALAKGASAAMVHRRPDNLAENAPLLLVADTMAALEDLGRASRQRTEASVIAVTGSVGKTGTKEALRTALEKFGMVHASAGSLNNQWGVPLSLARMPRKANYAVFELGMNHAGEIDALSRQVRPDVAIITTIEPAHLGFFDSVEAIADAKAEIFAGMDRRGAAILNRDNPHFGRLAAAAEAVGLTRIYGFGGNPDASIRLIDCHLHATASAVTASIMGEIVDYCLTLPGRHWVMNSLAVLGAVKLVGGDVGIAAASMSSLVPLAGRGKQHRLNLASGQVILIDESYNASPASMRAAIEVLGAARPGAGGRRIAVLGDMLELGDQAGKLHAALADPLDTAGIDLVFTVGADMRALHDALPVERRGNHSDSAATMAKLLAKQLRPGDIITIKGSHGSHMSEVVIHLLTLAAPAYAVKG